ncbi:Phosphatase PHOSPHO-type [Corchorus olitorius]|uniref:Phosphatase PHOSPHO-type n=1 Tax=Corchorus olitorius TaxID=93759 RepID=A0A1R3GRL8_9ROSI|nr:Phosphatase PHOSPHO-type [Corchorus olitorius]
MDTNQTFVDEEVRLGIFPYHDSNSSPHDCSLCPTNLCKVVVGNAVAKFRMGFGTIKFEKSRC